MIDKAMYSELLSGMPLMLATQSVFFRPTQKFLLWFKETYHYEGREIYDVGAGQGYASEQLRRLGYNPTAIDIRPAKKEITAGDGASYNYRAGSVVLLCRPCHGPFTEFVVSQAFSCKVTNFLYIGLEKNVVDDLGKYLKHFKVVLEGAGEDGEKVWLAKKLWAPSKNSHSSISGYVSLEARPWLGKKPRRRYDNKNLKRPVKASYHVYYGIGQHYFTNLVEADNPVWDPEYQEWVLARDDRHLNGRAFHDRCLTVDQARTFVLKTYRKHFARDGRHKLVWEEGKKRWFGNYKEGD